VPFLFKYTLIFEGQGHGFSETFYFERSTADMEAAWTFVQDYPEKRRPLLGREHYIKAQRLAYVRDDAGVAVKRITKVKKEFMQGTQAQPSEDTNTSLQVLCTNSAGNRKKLTFLGGPWNAIFPFGDSYNPDAGSWKTFFNAWGASLKAHGFGWLHATPGQQKQILNYTFNPDTGITTYTIQAPGIEWPETNKPAGIPTSHQRRIAGCRPRETNKGRPRFRDTGFCPSTVP